MTCVDFNEFPVKDFRCQVVSNKQVGHHLNLMWLKPIDDHHGEADPVFSCAPGQFVMMELPTDGFYFRRPMSVYATQPDGTFAIFYKIHGLGTELFASMEQGDELNVLGPLGNTFTLPNDLNHIEHMLLVGGGIGIAPMVALGEWLKAKGYKTPRCVYGVRGKAEVSIAEQMDATFGAERWALATDDGSAGFVGNVCQLLESKPDWIMEASQAAVCGPFGMMRAVTTLLKSKRPDLPIEASLEERMPCGTGACTGCVVGRCDQLMPSKTCMEGPIFNTDVLIWPGETPTVITEGGVSCPV